MRPYFRPMLVPTLWIVPLLAMLLSLGDALRIEAGGQGARFLVIAGKPLREPIAKYGPFVMNTEGEIRQAITDYQSGKF